MNLKVTCERCDVEITHDCHGEGLEKAVIDLYTWRPESGFPKALKNDDNCCKDDEGKDDLDSQYMPFFSETYLYALMGKDDARSLMSRITRLIEASGVEPRPFQMKAWEKLHAAEAAAKIEKERREAAKKRWAERMAPIKVGSSRYKSYSTTEYRGFYEFDYNVYYCERGECCPAKNKVKTKPKIVRSSYVKGNGMMVQCHNCKREHWATKAQVANWMAEKDYHSNSRVPAECLNSENVRRLLRCTYNV